MKKICCSFCLVLIILCFGITVGNAYNDGVKVFVVDKILTVDAIEENGYSMAPLRAYFESLGYSVHWNEVELSVTAKSNNTEIKMICNQKTAYVNGSAVDMPCAMKEYNGTTYAPVRSVAELSGYSVSWHGTSKTAVITDNSSALEFYPDTPHLMPKAESILNNIPAPETGYTDEKAGIYYKYDGVDENSALKYCGLLEQNYGFKYDSMQLGDNYAKYYIYVSERTCTMISVENGCMYIFPSVASSYAYEPIIEYDVSKTNKPVTDESENKTEGITDTQQIPQASLYENTQIPEFGNVTGCTYIKQTETESGYPVYVYYGSMFDIINYFNYLTGYCGFSDYTMNTQPFEMAMTYSASKDGTTVVIVYKMMTDTVYVSFEN